MHMETYTNEQGKECWRGIELDSPFNGDLFHKVLPMFEKDHQFAFHTNLGTLTVLNRLTGYGWRDTESGFRDPEGKFWLASSMFDVRMSGCKTVGAAIAWVKKNANNCVGA